MGWNTRIFGGPEMKNTKWKKLFLPLVAIFPLVSASERAMSADPSPAVATIQNVSGMATVLRQGQAITAKLGLEVWENDTLRTGPDGSIGVVFKDDTSLSLGPESVLVIDEFVFAPKQGKISIVVRMLKGTAAYISGLSSKLQPDSTRFETPSASLGIRGTKFVVKVEEK
jgi:hypothetical protein